MNIKRKTIYYLVSYGSVICAVIIIVASFQFRQEDPALFIAQIEEQVREFQRAQEEEREAENEYNNETPYDARRAHVEFNYEGLNQRNPFKVLIERPRPPEREPEPVPDFDINWATRNWRILGPMQGIPAMDIPDKMMIETERDGEPLQVAQGDTVEAESRHRGRVQIEIREINLREFSMVVGYYDEEKEADHSRKISMFGQ